MIDNDWTEEDERNWRAMSERKREHDKAKTREGVITGLRDLADRVEAGNNDDWNMRIAPIMEPARWTGIEPRQIGKKIVFTIMY